MLHKIISLILVFTILFTIAAPPKQQVYADWKITDLSPDSMKALATAIAYVVAKNFQNEFSTQYSFSDLRHRISLLSDKIFNAVTDNTKVLIAALEQFRQDNTFNIDTYLGSVNQAEIDVGEVKEAYESIILNQTLSAENIYQLGIDKALQPVLTDLRKQNYIDVVPNDMQWIETIAGLKLGYTITDSTSGITRKVYNPSRVKTDLFPFATGVIKTTTTVSNYSSCTTTNTDLRMISKILIPYGEDGKSIKILLTNTNFPNNTCLVQTGTDLSIDLSDATAWTSIEDTAKIMVLDVSASGTQTELFELSGYTNTYKYWGHSTMVPTAFTPAFILTTTEGASMLMSKLYDKMGLDITTNPYYNKEFKLYDSLGFGGAGETVYYPLGVTITGTKEEPDVISVGNIPTTVIDSSVETVPETVSLSDSVAVTVAVDTTATSEDDDLDIGIIADNTPVSVPTAWNGTTTQVVETDTNQTQLSILDKLTDIWEKVTTFDLSSLLIPADNYFTTYFNNLNDFISDRFGILYYPIGLTIDFINRFLNLSSGGDIIFKLDNDFKIPVGDKTYTIIPAFVYNMSQQLFANEPFKTIRQLYFAAVDFVIAFALVKLLQKKYSEVLMK